MGRRGWAVEPVVDPLAQSFLLGLESIDVTDTKKTGKGAGDQAELARRWSDLMAQSRHLAEVFAKGRWAEDAFSIVHPPDLIKAFMEVGKGILSDPEKLVHAQFQLYRHSLELWQRTMDQAAGKEVAPLVEPGRGDRRFKDHAWSEDVLFDYVKQSYLLTSRWVQAVVHDAPGLDPKTRDKVDFYTRQYLSALAPSNFALTNPAVLRRIRETEGMNLVKGLENLLEDLDRGQGRLQLSMTDEAAFEVGKNLATTPGKVVYQNALMQLVQYEPATADVYRRPFLFVPPWINKFYVLDLQPKNSLIKWLVDQGHSVFVISWVNPGRELAHKGFADYMHEGPLAALEAIQLATGEAEVNALGFCIGGILTSATLAYMAAKGDRRIVSATLLATMIDLTEVGEAGVFVDEPQLERLEEHVAEKGYLEGHHMATMFNMMRENDLIWSFVVQNYLLGRDPLPFDLLYWNSDSTRLPADMLIYYLRRFYIENGLVKPGHVVLDDVPIDLGKAEVPVYALATKDDHISPWVSCYAAVHAFKGPVRFVLGASGHIAGVINPPAAKKYCYWTNEKAPRDSERWLQEAQSHEGSWWVDWGAWLSGHGGPKVPARYPGDGSLKPIEDAPGAYVRARGSE